MTHQRIFGGVALSISALAIGVVGCGGNSGDGSPSADATGGSTSVGGAPGVAGTAVGTAGTPATTTPPPTSTGTTAPPPPTSTGTVAPPPPGAGGTTSVTPGTGGSATIPVGGAPGGGAPSGGAPSGGTSGGMVTGTDPTGWTASSNLDANGLLTAPTADVGYQIQTPTFALNPGQEVFRCFHSEMPNTGVFDVGDWESQMTPGSHHFILYRDDGDTTAAGTLGMAGCTVGFGGPTWLYTSGTPHSHLAFPKNVAMELADHQRMLFDMHYINTGSDPINVHVTLNVNKVVGTNFQKAQAQVSFNFGIDIPPNGMQTVGGDCTPPSTTANYFLMSTHTHKRGIDASITRKLASGAMGEVLVHTTNWDAPSASEWYDAPFLTFKTGEKFHYSCSYQNDRAQVVTVGTSAETNEMCMAITYFFPAMSGGSCT
ncbi:MAG TPA: hypothetical protein VH062_27520 [Polyangiaceae bacterium]|jgi:hypothetical protein|nr:hypothetical protein [Polyangiaceae bacterium]